MAVICGYCGKDAKLVTGEIIYPHRADLFFQKFWQCKPCDAYVGTHKGGTVPLGRLANAELRQWKVVAHAAFDSIWRDGAMSRSQAYDWLSKRLGISPEETHIGQFDVVTCQRVVNLCKQLNGDKQAWASVVT
jgi:hypothetical protein